MTANSPGSSRRFDDDDTFADRQRWDNVEDEDISWGRSVDPLVEESEPRHTGMTEGLVQDLMTATAALARLDERIAGAAPSVRAGWTARLLLEDAAAAARLDGWLTDPRRLLELDLGLAREANADDSKGLLVLQLLRAALRRSPRHLYQPAKLMAAAGLRQPSAKRRRAPVLPPWVELFLPDRDQVRNALSKALDREALTVLGQRPALLGAADLLQRWHESGAATVLGGTLGRHLTSAWLVRKGLLQVSLPLASVGWLGSRGAYLPNDREHWPAAFIEGLTRAADRGLQLETRLAAFRRSLLEVAEAAGSKSALPRVVEVLVARPAVTSAGLAAELGITPRAALGILSDLQARGLVVDMMGRKSFRAWAPAVRP